VLHSAASLKFTSQENPSLPARASTLTKLTHPLARANILCARKRAVIRNTCRTPKSAIDAPTFQITTTQTDKQKRALELIDKIKM
jgi:hypothetical protein